MRGDVSEFPATYAALATQDLIDAYAAGPARLRHALQGLSSSDLLARPRPGKWSILEIALHVTDSEIVGAGRIRLALAQSGAAFHGYDQDVWVQQLRHQDADASALDQSLALLKTLRASTLPLFTRATPAEWDQTASHPEYGPLTLRNLLELYADHVERHVEQIVACRRLLGCPKPMPSLLTPRLY